MPKLRTPSQPRSSQRSRLSDATLPVSKMGLTTTKQRGGSLDRRRMAKNLDASLDPLVLAKSPVYCNKYVVEQTEMAVINHVTPNRFDRHSDRPARQLPSPVQTRRAVSMPRTNYLEPPRDPSPTYTEVSVRSSRRKKRQYQPSPTIMSPLGYGHRSKYLDDPESDDDYYDDYYDSGRGVIKPVPIWLCVFLVVSYIVAGTFLFTAWERWPYLDSAYFCFITLTTIGFGDLFPSGRVNEGESFKQNIAFCSLYLLFGIALLAMSFNLVQEEVIANVKKVAKTLGIIKREEEDDEDDD
ncbi:potassium channel subfamily k [Holotrichia oblita]|uniref:Potassium channel subfamily k n=1 Tax=Holotrichia oblita TaxID=644536 RepID=A0ACB9SLK2_HOLOL|nr:potassium channel subfamily k [Holotrichia oblita]